MKLNTHLDINTTLSGDIVEIKENYAKVKLTTTKIMQADSEGLVHGGFIFSAADFCAMACINDPYVVLAKSNTKFLAPVKVGDIVILDASIKEQNGFKSTVDVVARVDDKEIFKGEFFTATLKQHVLSL